MLLHRQFDYGSSKIVENWIVVYWGAAAFNSHRHSAVEQVQSSEEKTSHRRGHNRCVYVQMGTCGNQSVDYAQESGTTARDSIPGNEEAG